MRAEDAGEDFGPATNAMTPVDGFNRPPEQTSALTQRSTMEGIAAVRFELEAMVARAEQRPRDEFQALEKMRTAARRPSFAEAALYAFPRGGQTISGPSIALLRPLAVYWRNIRCGWRILSDDEDSVMLQGFAHDVESNLVRTQEARVKKLVQRKNKETRKTEWTKPDERDLRELLGRHGSILERNCLLGVIPPDIVDDVVQHCIKTQQDIASGQLKASREDTIRAIVLTFAELGVTKEMLESKIQHPIETITPDEIVALRGRYKAIKDGMSTVDDNFERPQAAAAQAKATVTLDLDKAKPATPIDPPGGSALFEGEKAVKPKPR